MLTRVGLDPDGEKESSTLVVRAMVKRPLPAIAFVLLCSPFMRCQQLSTELRIPNDPAAHEYQLPAAILASPGKVWSIRLDLAPLNKIPADSLLVITDSSNKGRLETHIVSDAVGEKIE